MRLCRTLTKPRNRIRECAYVDGREAGAAAVGLFSVPTAATFATMSLKYWMTNPSLHTTVSLPIHAKSETEGPQEYLRVITVIGTMVLDQIVRQLMAQYHPPVNQGIVPAPLLDVGQMQVFKVPVVEEEAPQPVESDGASVVVVEDGREVVEGGGVGSHEGVFVG